LRNARAFPLLPAALASVPFGFVLVRVRVRSAVLRNRHNDAEIILLCSLSLTREFLRVLIVPTCVGL